MVFRIVSSIHNESISKDAGDGRDGDDNNYKDGWDDGDHDYNNGEDNKDESCIATLSFSPSISSSSTPFLFPLLLIHLFISPPRSRSL